MFLIIFSIRKTLGFALELSFLELPRLASVPGMRDFSMSLATHVEVAFLISFLKLWYRHQTFMAKNFSQDFLNLPPIFAITLVPLMETFS